MNSRAVANAILDLATRKGKRLTLMQLIKLVYLAHGWSLALLKRPLIKHPVQAWQYGPVIPNVYKAFSRFGSSPITSPAVDKQTGTIYASSLDDNEREIVDSVRRELRRHARFPALRFDASAGYAMVADVQWLGSL